MPYFYNIDKKTVRRTAVILAVKDGQEVTRFSCDHWRKTDNGGYIFTRMGEHVYETDPKSEVPCLATLGEMDNGEEIEQGSQLVS